MGSSVDRFADLAQIHVVRHRAAPARGKVGRQQLIARLLLLFIYKQPLRIKGLILRPIALGSFQMNCCSSFRSVSIKAKVSSHMARAIGFGWWD